MAPTFLRTPLSRLLGPATLLVAAGIGGGAASAGGVPARPRPPPPRRGAHASPAAPPPAFGDARLATRSACGACHQFDFPGETTPMQNTLREHAGSTLAEVECQSCHMPSVPGGSPSERSHRSHAFTVLD